MIAEGFFKNLAARNKTSVDYKSQIWDFDFACIDGIIENNKVNASWTKKMNVSKKKNQYYDMHYFFNTLVSKGFISDFFNCDADGNLSISHHYLSRINCL